MKQQINKDSLGIIIISAILCLNIWGCQSQDQNSASNKSEIRSLSVPSDSLSGEITDTFSSIDSSAGQIIYVPVYSHIYQQNQSKTFNLTATLSIRNVDISREFTLAKVLYYDSQGKLVKSYIDNLKSIGPLASTSFVVEENDLRGGVGANFIVVWKSDQPVFPPVVEAVMISTSQQQGISFVSHGRVIQQKLEAVNK